MPDPSGPGYIHAYCRTDEEKKVERQRLAQQAKDNLAVRETFAEKQHWETDTEYNRRKWRV